jgi:hypothetical protein
MIVFGALVSDISLISNAALLKSMKHGHRHNTNTDRKHMVII